MKFNYWPLRQEIKKSFTKNGEFASAMGMSETRLSLLLCGKANWQVDEIYRAVMLLGLVGRIEEFFFKAEQ